MAKERVAAQRPPIIDIILSILGNKIEITHVIAI
jgi:hypothetical protein